MAPRPPDVIEKIVRLLVPPASREHVLGDLSERYRSPRQYLMDVFHSLPLIIVSQVRRTSNIGGLGVVAITLFGLLEANASNSWRVAGVPTFLATVVLMLRDAYRTPTPTPFTQTPWHLAAIDVAAAAGCIYFWQALAALFAPQWLLPARALSGALPVFCILLFFVRLQAPPATFWPPAIARTMSGNELMAEVRGFEAVSRRAIRIEIGVAFVLVAVCIASLWAMPPRPLGKAFSAVTACGALFVAWFLHRHARMTPVAEGLEFAQSLTCYRRHLEQQLKRARTVIWWYCLPLACGPAVLVFGMAYQQANPLPVVIKGFSGFATICALILYMSRIAQRKLRRRITQLNEVVEGP